MIHGQINYLQITKKNIISSLFMNENLMIFKYFPILRIQMSKNLTYGFTKQMCGQTFHLRFCVPVGGGCSCGIDISIKKIMCNIKRKKYIKI